MKKFRKILALLLAVSMVTSSSGVTAWANSAVPVLSPSDIVVETNDEANGNDENAEESPSDSENAEQESASSENDVTTEESDSAESEETQPEGNKPVEDVLSKEEVPDPSPEQKETSGGEEILRIDFESVVPVNEEDYPSNQEMADLYANQVIYGDSTPFSNLGGLSGLNDNAKMIYDVLKERVTDIAANGGSAIIEFKTVPKLVLNHVYDNSLTGDEADEQMQLINNFLMTNLQTNEIMQCLLADCPAELYWFDKTQGMRTSGSWSVYSDHMELASLTITFSVYAPYQYEYTTTVNPNTPVAAINNAKAIAEEIKAMEGSNVEKLTAIKDKICELTSYNTAAAADPNPTDGNPWQIIYVFDEDSSTNVVCEGYAKAFQYLCDQVFTEDELICYSVTGWMAYNDDAELHMWNIVHMDGKNYLVDVTNTDTGSVGQKGQLFMVNESTRIGGVPALSKHENGITYFIQVSDDVNDYVTYQYDDNTLTIYDDLGVLEIINPHTHDNITFLPWDGSTELSEGNYYLTEDATADLTIVSGNVSLCLNGHTLTGSGNNSVITTNYETTFNLYDCGESGVITGGFGGYGGGIHAEGRLNLYGGTISGNTATGGGGVYTNAGLNLYDATITGNTADLGGGLYTSYPTEIYGGTVSGNTATTEGGGIYASQSPTLSGNPVIYGNTSGNKANNLYYFKERYIRIGTAGLSDGAKISVHADLVKGVYNSVVGADERNAAYLEKGYFLYDQEGINLGVVDQKICAYDNLHIHDGVQFLPWDGTTTYLPAGNYYLTEDATADLTFNGGTSNFCLNGHTLTGSGTQSVVSVNYNTTLNLYDCGKTGTITGGSVLNGGGLYIGGTLNMYGGNISGNTATQHGGAIYANGPVNLYGGTISGNTAEQDGGAIYSYQTLNLYGAILKENTAGSKGGAIFSRAPLGIHGGVISSNSAVLGGGGIYVAPNGTNPPLIFSGAPVIDDNTAAGLENNAYLGQGRLIQLDTNGLSDGAKIGVNSDFVTGAYNYITAADPRFATYLEKGYFTYDKAGTQLGLQNDQIYAYDNLHIHDGVQFLPWDGTTTYLPAGNYYLTEDATADLTFNGGISNFCLNGHTLTGSGTQSVVSVNYNTTLNLYDCGKTGTITGGSVRNGGGLYAAGTLNMYGGTISGNKAVTEDANSGLGGAIYAVGPVNIYGGTITGNSADDNGGGIYSHQTVTIYGGKISGNTANSGAGIYVHTPLAIHGGSITGNTAALAGGGIYVAPNGSNPPLIFSGAPVIDDNSAAGLENNAYLGQGRLIQLDTNGLSDGAKIGVNVDLVPGEEYCITAADERNSAYLEKGYICYDKAGVVLQLKENQIYAFEVAHNHDDVSFRPWDGSTELSEGNYYLTEDATADLTIVSGNVSLCLNGHTLTGSGTNSVITAFSGTNVTLHDCGESGTITGGNGDKGGAISAYGDLTIHGGTISGNTARSGGGVYANGETFFMDGGNITNNTATQDGGGIKSHAETEICGGVISGNTVATEYGEGGGILASGNLKISGTAQIINNSASMHGGGIDFHGDSLNISGGIISGNSAEEGAGINVYRKNNLTETGAVTISGDTEISGNTASNRGGALRMSGGTDLTISGSVKMENNTATQRGGGIYVANNVHDESTDTWTLQGAVNITGATFTGNKAQDGAAIWAESASLTVKDATFNKNEATRNGAAILSYCNSTDVSNTIMDGNTARTGTGIFCSSTLYDETTDTTTLTGSLTVSDSRFTNNTATGSGAAIFAYCAEATVDGCNINSNSSKSGTIYVDEGVALTISGDVEPITSGAAVTDNTFEKAYEVDFDYVNDADVSTKYTVGPKEKGGTAVFDFDDEVYFTVKMVAEESVILNMSVQYDKAIDAAFGYEADLQFFNFMSGHDQFSKAGELFITLDEHYYLYELVNGTLSEIPTAKYVADYVIPKNGQIKDGWLIETDTLGYYIASDHKLVVPGTTTISNNSASLYGGGIYAYNSTVTLSGAPLIDGNSCNGAADNLYLDGDSLVRIGNGGLSAGAKIGVTHWEGKGVVTEQNSLIHEAYAGKNGYFVSDNANFETAVVDNKVVLSDPHVHSYNYNAEGMVITASCDCGVNYKATAKLASTVYSGAEIPLNWTFSEGWPATQTPSVAYTRNGTSCTSIVNPGAYVATVIFEEGKAVELQFSIGYGEVDVTDLGFWQSMFVKRDDLLIEVDTELTVVHPVGEYQQGDNFLFHAGDDLYFYIVHNNINGSLEDCAYTGAISKDWRINASSNDYVENISFATEPELFAGVSNIPMTLADQQWGHGTSDFNTVDKKLVRVELCEDWEDLSSSKARLTLYIADAKNRTESTKATIAWDLPKLNPTMVLSAGKTEDVSYGDKVTYAATVSKTDYQADELSGSISFYLLKENGEKELIQTIDALNGSVTLDKMVLGIHTVLAEYSGNNCYNGKEVRVTTTVGKRQLTWDTSELWASKRQMVHGEVIVHGSVKLAGVVDGETVEFNCPSPLMTSGLAEQLEVGEFIVDVVPKQGDWTFAAELENYIWPEGNPRVLATVNKVKEEKPKEQPKDEKKELKLETEVGLSETPAALVNDENLNTPGKIKAAMETQAKEIIPEADNEEIQVAMFDLQLLTKDKADESDEWQETSISEAVEEQQITVTLPYPEGTDPYNYEFTLLHMLTQGDQAGTIEEVETMNTEEGIQFVVDSFSPFAVVWKETKVEIPDDFKGEAGLAVQLINNGVKTSGATIQLFRNDVEVATALSDAEGKFSFEELAAGDYQLIISKDGYVTREEIVTVGADTEELKLSFCVPGDVNMDGKVTILDVDYLFNTYSNENRSDYEIKVSDVNGYGGNDILDVDALFQKV